MTTESKRRLAAIMFTDIVGYSKFMLEDEKHGRSLRERHRNIFEKCTEEQGGKIVQYFGDGTLSVFESAVSAVECAVSMQRAFQKDPKVPLRIGIHIGDIIYDETEAFGHGVNIAARIEPVCNPGGIFISDKVYDEIKNQTNIKAKSLGNFQFKNIAQEIGLYAIQERGIPYPDDRAKAMIKELSGKSNIASAAERSGAFYKFNSIERKKKRKNNVISSITLAAVFIAVFVFVRFKDAISTFLPSFEKAPISIAVLPFVNMNGTDENEYFSNGITEDILSLISRLDGFSVTSRTSVMQYKDTKKTMKQIGEELGVDHLLEGSVRREGNKVRITAQLINAERDDHIWAKTYDEELISIFDVQTEVASDIASHLRKNLSPSDKEKIKNKNTADIAAYEHYLKGRELYRKYTPDDNDSAIVEFKKALDTEPEYAYAYAGLGDAYAQKAYHNKMDKAILDSAILVSKKAIEIDPKLSEGHKALGLAYHYKGNTEDALKEYKEAIKLDPYNDMASNNIGQIEFGSGNIVDGIKWAEYTLGVNKNVPTSVVNLARMYSQIGEDEKATSILDEGISGNPDKEDLIKLKGQVLIQEGKYEEAKVQGEKLVRLKPESPDGYTLLSNIHIHRKEWDEAAEYITTASKYCVDTNSAKQIVIKTMSAFVDQQKGNEKEALNKWDDVLRSVELMGEEKEVNIFGIDVLLSSIFSALGNEEEALKHLKKAKDKNWLNYKEGSHNPMFEKLRGNSEFQFIMKDMQFKADSLKTKLKSGNT